LRYGDTSYEIHQEWLHRQVDTFPTVAAAAVAAKEQDTSKDADLTADEGPLVRLSMCENGFVSLHACFLGLNFLAYI